MNATGISGTRKAVPEFSRPWAVDRVSPQGAGKAGALAAPWQAEIEATPEECRAVATRLMIPDVLALRCRFALRREPGRIVAEGALSARVTRDCVVTLEPFDTDLAEDFAVHFVPEGFETEDDDPLAPDQIAYAGSSIDLGEAAVEQLALALDPYPRRPGAALEPSPEEEIGETRQPFAALQGLRRPDPSKH